MALAITKTICFTILALAAMFVLLVVWSGKNNGKK